MLIVFVQNLNKIWLFFNIEDRFIIGCLKIQYLVLSCWWYGYDYGKEFGIFWGEVEIIFKVLNGEGKVVKVLV